MIKSLNTYKVIFWGIIITLVIIVGGFNINYQWRQINEIQQQLASVDTGELTLLSEQNELLMKNLQKLDGYLLNKTNGKGIQQLIITDLDKIKQIKSIAFNITKVSDVKSLETETYESSIFFVELKGSFSDLLQTINYVEKKIDYVKISSTHLYAKKRPNENKYELYGKLFFQSVLEKN